jgi:hypothetical protein
MWRGAEGRLPIGPQVSNLPHNLLGEILVKLSKNFAETLSGFIVVRKL